jgi:hypothetical protein
MSLSPFCSRLSWKTLVVVFSLGWAPLTRASGTITNCTEGDLRNGLIGGGAVQLNCDSIITLTSPIVIAKSVVIDGTGHTATLSPSGTTNGSPIFMVQPGASLTLRQITLSSGTLRGASETNGAGGGSATGAAIYNDHGSVLLDGCTLSGNSVTGGNGSGSVASAQPGGDGGAALGAAVYNLGGHLTITNSTFSGNSAAGGAGGGGAAGANGVNGSNGAHGGNGGQAGGAAIYNTASGLVTIYSSLFSSNFVVGSSGGLGGPGSGLLGFPGDNGNSGPGLGAAILNENGMMAIVNSTFLNNTITGGVGNSGTDGSANQTGTGGSAGGTAEGAGVFCNGGVVLMTNCTFAANSLVGGLGGTGGTGEQSQFGTDGAEGGAGGEALGAGLCAAPGGSIVIVNCTFSDNSVTGGSGGGGGAGSGLGGNGPQGHAGNALGGAVFNAGGNLQLKNSILADSISGNNAGGNITDEGYNLSSDATPAFTAAGSRNRIDPLLGGLSQAGGVVPTLTLSSNSPAINAITAPDGNGCPTFDQRNAMRVPPYDIGAFEFDGSFGAPTLQVQLQASQLQISWAQTGAFTLQSTTALANSNLWQNVAIQPTSAAGVATLNVLLTNTASFYRLVQP